MADASRKVCLNYVTFLRDLEWLEFSLESFRKYCKGFSWVIIVVPTNQTKDFMYLEKRFGTPECPVWIRGFYECPEKGFVHHLAQKCCADLVAPEATHILHMDPDCLWTTPTTPGDYFVDGKPVLVTEPYEVVRMYHPGRFHWKSVAESNLGFETEFETMCRHPAIHIPKTYRKLREVIEAHHRTNFIDYVLKQKNQFPMGYGEFNALGAVAVKFFPDEYHFHDCGFERVKNIEQLRRNAELPIGHPKPHIEQGWSYLGVNSIMPRIREILK